MTEYSFIGRFLTIYSTLLIITELLRLSASSWLSFDTLCFSRNRSFHLSCQTICRVVPFIPLLFWQYRSSDFPSFFPDIGHLCLLFSLSVLLEINQFCWSRNQLLVLLIFPNLFPAVFSHWFLLVLLLFPSFCLRWVFTALFPVS